MAEFLGQQAAAICAIAKIVELLIAGEILPEEDCTCGYGGIHEDANPLCARNRARNEGLSDD